MNNETKDFWGVLKFINEHGGIENFRCFAQLPAINYRTPFGFCLTGDKYTWVECKINESRYLVSDGYKISLEPLDSAHFTWEHYEQSDFKQLIKQGYIIPKTSDKQSVHHVVMAEHLCGCAYLIHEGDIVV